ncbi:hypothetical protein IGI04_012434 [Brassica rapa subsp. trilocularis]|uniref:Uncharacterized protein n=1 Tax=Brassica rapa subsp. trilocularis TaxID=1813537 RepID=A0ABQ7N895_BRACM|nr:hypothetical protein IGI04_012434 [Brassica rapa subsp. trilocularis]
MLIKRIELCIEIVKKTMDFAVVVAEAAKVFLRNAPQAPPALLRQGPYYYSASTPQKRGMLESVQEREMPKHLIRGLHGYLNSGFSI